eukprot:m.290219 g.290219  ORF g.290219 m.290219 type:complete len:320 (-) comp12253_c0_seq1:416-1375(-)
MSDASSDVFVAAAPFGADRLHAADDDDDAQQPRGEGDLVRMHTPQGDQLLTIIHSLLWEPHTQVLAVDTQAGPAVLKLADKTDGVEQLATEERILSMLAEGAVPGVPQIVAHGSAGHSSALLLQPLGVASVQALMDAAPDGHLPVPTVCAIAENVLRILAGIWEHEVCVVDIAPNNMIQVQDGSFQLIDFGSAHHRSWPVPANPLQHRVFAPLRSAARNCNPSLIKPPLSPAYDLVTLAYCLVFMATGRLPWLDMDAMSMRMSKVQCRRNPKYLCSGLPPIFEQFCRWAFALSTAKWDVPEDTEDWASRFGRFASGTAV